MKLRFRHIASDIDKSVGPVRGSLGFSMIEVLVALFVTSVGLLGLAALQMTSLQFSHNTHMRSQATFLAKDILERMRANVVDARSGGYDIALATAVGSGTDITTVDLGQWKGSVGTLLPAGKGAVATANGFVTVTIQWSEQENAAQTFNYSTRL